MVGGNLIENGTHFYDISYFLLESEIKEVCVMSNETDMCDDEPGIVTARNSNGTLLNCVLSDFLPGRSVIEIFGENCILRVSLHRFDGIEYIPLHSCDGNVKKPIAKLKTIFQGVASRNFPGSLWRRLQCLFQKPVETFCWLYPT